MSKPEKLEADREREERRAQVVNAMAGDPRALEALLLSVGPRVRRFAGSLCENPADAEEVAQEALLQAVVSLPGLRDPAAFYAWIFSLTRRQAGRLRRRAGRRPEAPLPELETASATADPEGLTAATELGGAFTAAMGRLPVGQRLVVLLRDVEGLPAAEVALALQLELATVKTRLHRGRAALRAELSPMLSPNQPTAACPDVVDRFSRFLEGEIDPAACASLQAHVEACPSCHAACASLRRSVNLCQEQGERGAIHPATRARVQAALRGVIHRSPSTSLLGHGVLSPG